MPSRILLIIIALVLIAFPSTLFAEKGEKLRIHISNTISGGKIKLTVISKLKNRKNSKLELQRNDGEGFFTFAEVREPKRKEKFTDSSAGHGSHWYMAKLTRKGKVSESRSAEVLISESLTNPEEDIITIPQPPPPTRKFECNVSVPVDVSECPVNFPDDVLNLVNLERGALGLNALSPLSELSCSSRIHTVSMINVGVMSHDGWIEHLREGGFTGNRAGQNVAVGFATPSLVMLAWMNSPGHKANILSPKYTHLGVGCLSYKGGLWWTQDFGGL